MMFGTARKGSKRTSLLYPFSVICYGLGSSFVYEVREIFKTLRQVFVYECAVCCIGFATSLGRPGNPEIYSRI